MDETGDIEPSEYESIKEELLNDLFGNHGSLDPFQSKQKIPRTPDSKASNRSRPLTGDVPLPTRSVSPPVPKPSSRGQDPGRCFQDCIKPCRSMNKRHFHCKTCDYISDRLDNMKRHIPYHFLTTKKERQRAPDGIKMVGHAYFTDNCSDENCSHRNEKYKHFHCTLCKTWGCNGKKNYNYRLKHLSNAHDLFFGEDESLNVAVERKRTKVIGQRRKSHKISTMKKLLPYPAPKEDVLNARRRAKCRSTVKANQMLSGVKPNKDDARKIPVTIDYLHSISQSLKSIMEPIDEDSAGNLAAESEILNSVTVASEPTGYAKTPLESTECASTSQEYSELKGMTEEFSEPMDEGISSAACPQLEHVCRQVENVDHETMLQANSESMDVGSRESPETNASKNFVQLPTSSDTECSITIHGSVDTILEILNTLQKSGIDISDQRDFSSLSTTTGKKGFLDQVAAILGESSSVDISEYRSDEKQGENIDYESSQGSVDEHSNNFQNGIDQQMEQHSGFNRNNDTDQSKVDTCSHQILEDSKQNRNNEKLCNQTMHRNSRRGSSEDEVSESSITSTDEGFSEILDINSLNDRNRTAITDLENSFTREGLRLDLTTVQEYSSESHKIVDFLSIMLVNIEENKASESQL